MAWKTSVNLLFCAINATVLSLFLYPPPHWVMPIYFALTEFTWIEDIRKKMQIVALCSFVAAFCTIPAISDLFSIFAIGLAVSVGYQIDSESSPCIVNSCISLGIIIGSITSDSLTKYSTARDVAILMFTLPNLFMSENSTHKKEKSTLWFVNCLYDRTWTYSVGFVAGMFLPLPSITKHTRFFIISLILLMAIFVKGTVYEQILSTLRGFFIYDETGHKSEFYFLIGFICVDIIIPAYSYNYLFVGYLVIGVILWHQN
jgi:hypothetical protein